MAAVVDEMRQIIASYRTSVGQKLQNEIREKVEDELPKRGLDPAVLNPAARP